MTDTWRFIVVVILVLTVATLLPFVAEAQSGRASQSREGHHGDCRTLSADDARACEQEREAAHVAPDGGKA